MLRGEVTFSPSCYHLNWVLKNEQEVARLTQALRKGRSICKTREVGTANVFGQLCVLSIASVCRAPGLAEPQAERVGMYPTVEESKCQVNGEPSPRARGSWKAFKWKGKQEELCFRDIALTAQGQKEDDDHSPGVRG